MAFWHRRKYSRVFQKFLELRMNGLLGRLTKFWTSSKLEDRCRSCGFCGLYIACPGEANCSGCGACVAACPNSAKFLKEVEEERKSTEVKIDGRVLEVPERITVLRALKLAGYQISELPDEGEIFAPCRTGGCWSCAVLIDGELKPSCIAQVREGMRITTKCEALERLETRRLVTGFQGHQVGGVGTPYWLKPRGLGIGYIEVACFAHGCILRCPTCQNWQITYSSIEEPLIPSRPRGS